MRRFMSSKLYPLFPSSIKSKESTAHVRNDSPISKRSTSVIISKWSTGWSTIRSMYFLYFLSAVLALIHLMLFRYLDGKLSSKASNCLDVLTCVKEKAKSQAYISAASILLSNAFSIAIRSSLAFASTQYLWNLFRISAMKISTIELLFNLQANFFKIFHPAAVKQAWILVLMALLLYLIPIATSFPPGALTIESKNFVSTVEHPIPTYNASDVGNGSFADANRRFVNGLTLKSLENYPNRVWFWADMGSPPLLLQRLVTGIFLDGQIPATPSPCGLNCSYALDFEGPSFKCYSNTRTTGKKVVASGYPVPSGLPILPRALDLYNSSWVWYLGPRSNLSAVRINMLQNISASFNETEAQDIIKNSEPSKEYFFPVNITITELEMKCVPFRSLYSTRTSYRNGERTLDYTHTEIAPIPISEMSFPNNLTVLSEVNGERYLNWTAWTSEQVNWFRDTQLAEIVNVLGFFFEGSYGIGETFISLPSSSVIWELGIFGTESINGFASTLLPLTNFLVGSQSNESISGLSINSPTFKITERQLNQLIANLTIAMIPLLNLWHENINVTQNTSQNVYTFSEPLNLILPYSLSLALVFPFLLIGTYALLQNGVPAIDGGFIQILSTTTGNPTLQMAAAGNCLGGEEHPSKHLSELKIRYGELIGLTTRVGGVVVRRAGFGTEDEVVPLRKGEKYGVVGKI